MRYDVVVVGGAVSGAATALLLRRRQPDLRILVVERNPKFDYKVGESTVEVSGFFLTRVLRLYDYLSREHLPKQSFRYWFHNGDVKGIRDAAEVGPGMLARMPAFQIDRSKFDEDLLAMAVQEGAELWRPAKVLEIHLPEELGRPDGRVVVERDGERIDVDAGWIVDASGRFALVARKRGWLKPLKEHPTSSIWARYRNVKDLDGVGISGRERDDPWARRTIASRRLATNHFMGYGYWIWLIPLQGGETSIGAVWDTRLVDPPGKTSRDKLEWFLKGNPLTRELTEGATLIEGDLRGYAQLPYLVDRVAGPGFSLVGDACGFLDPFYSPGLDNMAYSVTWTVEMLRRRRDEWKDPMKLAEGLKAHDAAYRRFFRYFFEVIYLEKYHVMGDYDTMMIEFLLDTSLYYFFNVMPTYWWSERRMLAPPFYPRGAEYVHGLIGLYHRRAVAIAKRKQKLGVYGRRNAGRYLKLLGFELGPRTVRMFFWGLCWWLGAELRHWGSFLFRPGPMRPTPPQPQRPPEAELAPPAEADLPPLAPTQSVENP
jgi:flavin-dependent dehydrogenase